MNVGRLVHMPQVLLDLDCGLFHIIGDGDKVNRMAGVFKCVRHDYADMLARCSG